MNFFETSLSGAYEIEIEPFRDDRGFFARTFCKKEFEKIGFFYDIIQINHSMTRRNGTIRGLHYQISPASEIKIIRCIQGAVFDVIVDLRTFSPTFLHWHGVELSRENQKMIFVPSGFAHGFQTLSDAAELIYLHSEFYNPEYENGLRFNDPSISIKWPLPLSCISEKDSAFPLINASFKGITI